MTTTENRKRQPAGGPARGEPKPMPCRSRSKRRCVYTWRALSLKEDPPRKRQEKQKTLLKRAPPKTHKTVYRALLDAPMQTSQAQAQVQVGLRPFWQRFLDGFPVVGDPQHVGSLAPLRESLTNPGASKSSSGSTDPLRLNPHEREVISHILTDEGINE